MTLKKMPTTTHLIHAHLAFTWRPLVRKNSKFFPLVPHGINLIPLTHNNLVNIFKQLCTLSVSHVFRLSIPISSSRLMAWIWGPSLFWLQSPGYPQFTSSPSKYGTHNYLDVEQSLGGVEHSLSHPYSQKLQLSSCIPRSFSVSWLPCHIIESLNSGSRFF